MLLSARTTHRRMLATLFAITGLLLGGCASTGSSGQQKANKTVTSVEKLAAELTTLGTHLGASTATMDQLQGSVETKGVFSREQVATGDLQAVYKGYGKALADVRSSAKRVTKANESLRASMTAYVQAWEQDLAAVQSASLREASLERRAAAQERFDEVATEFGELWQRVDAHVAHLGEIELALGADLTPAGIDAVEDDPDSAEKTSASLQKDLTAATEKLAAFAESVRASAPPPPAPEA
jgi:outer membrane murein-binding lipoprotein Lpp